LGLLDGLDNRPWTRKLCRGSLGITWRLNWGQEFLLLELCKRAKWRQ